MVSASSISDPIIQLIASLALAFVLYAASFPSVMDSLTAGTITVVFLFNDCTDASTEIADQR